MTFDEDDFEDAGTLQQIPDGGIRIVDVGEEEVMLVRFGAEVHALGARCTHAFASLRDGVIEGATLRCRRHGAVFDLKTGRSLSGSCPPLPRFAFEVRNGRVFVKKGR